MVEPIVQSTFGPRVGQENLASIDNLAPGGRDVADAACFAERRLKSASSLHKFSPQLDATTKTGRSVTSPRRTEAQQARSTPGQLGDRPHFAATDSPGSRMTTACPLGKACGGQVMGSTARLRRLTSGRSSPEYSIRLGVCLVGPEREADFALSTQERDTRETVLIALEVGEAMVEPRLADGPCRPEIELRSVDGRYGGGLRPRAVRGLSACSPTRPEPSSTRSLPAAAP
jgi:hypothetical protein